MATKPTLETLHAHKKKRNLLTALIVVLGFGGFALASIVYNILVRG